LPVLHVILHCSFPSTYPVDMMRWDFQRNSYRFAMASLQIPEWCESSWQSLLEACWEVSPSARPHLRDLVRLVMMLWWPGASSAGILIRVLTLSFCRGHTVPCCRRSNWRQFCRWHEQILPPVTRPLRTMRNPCGTVPQHGPLSASLSCFACLSACFCCRGLPEMLAASKPLIDRFMPPLLRSAYSGRSVACHGCCVVCSQMFCG
jgi:hypothetical protein